MAQKSRVGIWPRSVRNGWTLTRNAFLKFYLPAKYVDAAPAVDTVYQGSTPRAQRYLGSRTDQQLYLGAKTLFP